VNSLVNDWVKQSAETIEIVLTHQLSPNPNWR